MAAHSYPPTASRDQDQSWRTVSIAGRSYLVRPSGKDGWAAIPTTAAVARGPEDRPRVALTTVLSRAPHPGEPSIAPLIAGGSFSLVCSLGIGDDELAGLKKKLEGPVSPWFIRSGEATLCDDSQTLVSAQFVGSSIEFPLGCWLPSNHVFDVLRSFNGGSSSLRIALVMEGVPAELLPSVSLDDLLDGVLDGRDRTMFLSLTVVNADGTTTPVPALSMDAPGSRDAGSSDEAPVQLLAMGSRVEAVTRVMSPNTRSAPLAAALVPAATAGTRINTNAQYWLTHNSQYDDTGDDPPPPDPLPMLTTPAGPTWQDASNSTTIWYAPVMTLALPKATDTPETSPFTFTVRQTGAALGTGGVQAGIAATIRFSVSLSPPAGMPAGLTPKQVSLDGLGVALEVPYRQTGSTAVVTQRLPATIAQNGNRLDVTVEVLDDWARLTYSALAFPLSEGLPAARLVVTYAVNGYQTTRVRVTGSSGGDGGGSGGPGHHPMFVAGGRKTLGIDVVTTRRDLPASLDRPVLVASEFAIVGPQSYVQFNKEARQRGVTLSARLPAAAAVTTVSPLLTLTQRWVIRLVRRQIVREEGVPLALACSTYGAFYLQRSGQGVTVAMGCQDALKLGQASPKAYEEIQALRSSTYRVYRSRQQPGRFLVSPLSYRVGRYSASEGAKAFRPMILMYGALDPDPTKNRYFIVATLVPDVSAYQLALLNAALRDYVAAGAKPSIFYPTDPFAGATATYAWAVPDGLDRPQTTSVVDTMIVTLSMSLENALLQTTMIERSGLQGSAQFTTSDGSQFSAALTLNGGVIGPAETGPVLTALAGTACNLTNATRQSMVVLDVAAVNAQGTATVVAANVTLAPGATSQVTVPAGTVSAVAEARLATDMSIDELDVFVENITVTVTFINQLTFSNHALTALRVRARLKGSDQVADADCPEGKVSTVTFTLPITNYLAQQTLQFALIETRAQGSTTTDWREWDLNRGAVIGLTADYL